MNGGWQPHPITGVAWPPVECGFRVLVGDATVRGTRFGAGIKSRRRCVEEFGQECVKVATRYGFIIGDEVSLSGLGLGFGSDDGIGSIVDMDQIEPFLGITHQRLTREEGRLPQQTIGAINARETQDHGIGPSTTEQLLGFEYHTPRFLDRVRGCGFINPFTLGLSVNTRTGDVKETGDRWQVIEDIPQAIHIGGTHRGSHATIVTHGIQHNGGLWERA